MTAPYPSLENRTVPGLGQTVLYTLTPNDVMVITEQREHARLAAHEPPYVITRSGNPVEVGDVYAADVVRVHGLDADAVNLQVRLDGSDLHWVERATEGTAPGCWTWPQD